MMDTNLEWTEQIGDAFLAQQDAVMDSIQRLRHRAAAAGALILTPQQTVSTEDQDIQIEPASPGVVYVPYYDPLMIYGPLAVAGLSTVLFPTTSGHDHW